MEDSTIIVGAGQAAAECATALRAGGYSAPITIVGDEPYLPYQRPPLSKDFLSGKSPFEKLLLRPEDFWRNQKVDLELGSPVKSVDRQRKRLELAKGHTIDYGTLVLATGTRSRIPPIEGIALDGVYLLRRIEDVNRLRPALHNAKRVAIIGGGYIGLEVAAVARSEGREVVVLEAEERVMKRVTSQPISSFYESMHRGHGVDVRLRSKIDAIEGETRATGVRAGGEHFAADLILIATGSQPNQELAAEAGLACDNGVVVDEFARTGDPHIYAIGDCTRFPSRRFGRSIRLECVQNAFDQAKAAATAILGKGAPYDPVPWFWSDQYHVKFQSAGLSEGHDDMAIVGDPAGAHFSVEYRKAGKLIAVDAVNDGRAYMAGRKRITMET
jgi:3-phenylpropionate/trans-cinnamate dioxygenase ferredoxin reductase component